MLIGRPGPIQSPLLPPTMAWDKMVERLIGVVRVALGIKFDSRRMIITVEHRKVERIKKILTNTWNTKRKKIVCLDAAKLIGNIIAVVPVCPWLQWSMLHLMAEFIRLLRKNHKHHAKSKDFKALFEERDDHWMEYNPKLNAQRLLLNCSYMSAVWRDVSTTFISTNIRSEIEYIRQQCDEHLTSTHQWY